MTNEEIKKIESAINFVDYCTPAETNELPTSKEAYERAARIVAQMHPEKLDIPHCPEYGKWIPHKAPFLIQSVYSCSKCNSSVPGNIFVVGCDFEFCPYCGARME